MRSPRGRRARARRRHSPKPGDHERHGEHDARVLRRRGEPSGDARPLQAIGDEERERHGDPEGQEHVRDGHARVGDVGRRDGDPDCADDAREASVRRPAEPPGRCDARDADDHGDDPRRSVRRCVGQHLRGREHQEQQARIVVPAGVETSAVDELPRPRHDVRLVGVEERQAGDRTPRRRPEAPQRARGSARGRPARPRGPSAA